MEMAKKEQIQYWVNTATDDLQTADLLISNDRFIHGLFFCHLCIEKLCKAHIVKDTGEVPPKSHNLLYLVSKSDLLLTEDQKDICGILMTYQLEGQYPEYYPSSPSVQMVNDLFSKTKELFTCLKEKL
jgi:HEPN domain-containing protein